MRERNRSKVGRMAETEGRRGDGDAKDGRAGVILDLDHDHQTEGDAYLRRAGPTRLKGQAGLKSRDILIVLRILISALRSAPSLEAHLHKSENGIS